MYYTEHRSFGMIPALLSISSIGERVRYSLQSTFASPLYSAVGLRWLVHSNHNMSCRHLHENLWTHNKSVKHHDVKVMTTDRQGFLDPSVSLETRLQEDKAFHPQVEVEPDNRHHV
jgi:hypothetical protein